MTIESQVVLSLVRALLGAISANLRSVSFEVETDTIHLLFLFDGEISDDDRDGVLTAAGEVIADFPAPMIICENVERLDYPDAIQGRALKRQVYRRRELMASDPASRVS
jgi:hypothetical protein